MLGSSTQVLAEIADDAAQPASVMALRGDALLALGRQDEAHALYSRLLEAHPDQVEALLGLARLSALDHQVPAAELLLAQALKSAPANLDALRLQGDLLRLQGKNGPPRLAYMQILKIKPDNTQAHIDLANLDIVENRYAEASAQLSTARKTAPNSRACCKHGPARFSPRARTSGPCKPCSWCSRRRPTTCRPSCWPAPCSWRSARRRRRKTI